MILAGVIASAVAKLLMPAHPASGLFILGIAGSIIAGVMQYSQGLAPGLIIPAAGAVTLLALYAAVARRKVEEKPRREDLRKAA